MGLFDKIKKVFVSKEKEDKVYDEGLKKSRNEFVSQLSNLSKKYKNISEDYFEELEKIGKSRKEILKEVLEYYIEKENVKILKK